MNLLKIINVPAKYLTVFRKDSMALFSVASCNKVFFNRNAALSTEIKGDSSNCFSKSAA